MTLNSRMTVTTAVACVLVSTVLLPLFIDILWFVIGAGAVIAVAVTSSAPHSACSTVLWVCLSGAGCLAMLSADARERIRVWGRLVSLWRSAPRYGRAPGGAFDGAGSDGRGLDGRGLDRRAERRPG